MNGLSNPQTPIPVRPRKRAILYLSWGREHDSRVLACIRESHLPPYDVFWITDHAPESVPADVRVVRVKFSATRGNQRKAQLGRFVPAGYDSYLYLDTDTRVLSDVDLGFELAERNGLGLVPASAYDLATYMNAVDLMREEDIPVKGQLIYNTGVIFFAPDPRILALLRDWDELATRLQFKTGSDQLTLALALEKSGVQPAALSVNFNCRAFGELLRGTVRIWHSVRPVPKNLNRHPNLSRRVVKGRVRMWTGMKALRWPYGWRRRIQP
jgi:hypothetical protein